MHLPHFNHFLPGLLLIFLSSTPLLYGEDEDIPIFLSIQKKLADKLLDLDLEFILSPENEPNVREFIIAQRCIEQHIQVQDPLRFSRTDTHNFQTISDKYIGKEPVASAPQHMQDIEEYVAEFQQKHRKAVTAKTTTASPPPSKNNFSAADVFRKEQYVSKSKPNNKQRFYVYVELPSKTYHPKEVEYVWSRMWFLYGDLLQKGIQLIAICDEQVPDDALQGAVKYNVKMPVILAKGAELPYYTPSPKASQALFTILDQDFNLCTRMAPPNSDYPASSGYCYKISFTDFEQEMLRRKN